jgi:glyoxylase-like metal-dependent hydrolase (beta-lactamase superfamily II)
MTAPHFQDFDHGISVIDAEYQRRGLAAIYLMIEGNRAALIDTGTSLSVPGVLSVLHSKRMPLENVDFVIPTHVHLDHAGGAGTMMRNFPNARLVVHPRGARHMIDPSRLIAGVSDVYGPEWVTQYFGEILPVSAERVIEAPDHFTLDFNGRELLFLDTPGHARHHFAVIDKHSGGIFAGDTFGVSYREFDTKNGEFILPATPPVQFDPPAHHATIDRLAELRPRRIFLTHFGFVTEVDRLARDMHELLDAYVELAGQVRGAGTDRLGLLIQGQRAILYPRLAQHGCKLREYKIDMLLAGDLKINAQGLAFWLDHDSSRKN